MNSENEKNQLSQQEVQETAINETEEKNTNEDIVNEESVGETSEETLQIEKIEDENANENEEVSNEAEEFISEFAPAPINIPNYNKKKALAKSEKAKIRKKKRNSKKSRRRRKMLRKVVLVIRTIMMFVLLLSVISATLAVLVVKLNTSEYSVENAIRVNSPERFVVGEIKDPVSLNLKESSTRASLADIIRDNSMIMVTYDDIEQAVTKSSYPEYISSKVYDALNYYLYGQPYREITANEISELLLKNASYIELVTGQKLGDTAADAFGEYIADSPAVREASVASMKKQPLAKYTYITSVVLSMTTLTALVIALLLLLILTVITCGGFVHRMIGGCCMLAGAAMCALVVAGKMFFEPLYKPSTEFIKCIVAAMRSGFETSAMIYGGLTFLLGLIIMLIGHAMADNYYEDEETDEADYIDEIEQVSTAQ